MKPGNVSVLFIAALSLVVAASELRAADGELIAPAPPAATQSVSADLPANAVALRVRFGQKDQAPTDWSGSIKLEKGRVLSISGWRWLPGDHAQGDSWTLKTHRLAPNQQPREVPDNAKGPVEEVGLIINLADIDPGEKVTIDAKPGSATFALSALSKGQRLHALKGNIEVERVPLVVPLASTWADEDYPASAPAKNGTVYVAYVAFTRGKDFQGARERVASPLATGAESPLFNGLIVRHINAPGDFEYLREKTGGEQIYLRSLKDGKWGQPVAVTDGSQEIYRPSVAVDGAGKVWVFYPAHLNAGENLEAGDWDLVARSFDPATGKFSDAVNISNAPGTDFFNAAATDSAGRVWVTWVGQRDGTFHIFAAHQTAAGSFSPGQRVTNAAGNEWEPAIATDKNGNVAIAWDTYAKGDYDVYLAKKNPDDSFAKEQAVAATLAFEVRPSLAYDASDRLWVAWEQSGDNWGKEFGALKKKGIPLYQGNRAIGLKVLDTSGQWHSAPNPNESLVGTQPKRAGQQNQPGEKPIFRPHLGVAPSFPRLFADSKGQIYLAFRGRQGANWRVQVGSVWFEFLSKLDGDRWQPAQWLPHSNNILDNRPTLAETPDGKLKVIFSGDGRGDVLSRQVADPHTGEVATAPTLINGGANRNPRGRKGNALGADPNNDLFVASVDLDADGIAAAPHLTPIAAEVSAQPTQDVADERAAIQAARDYRINLNGETLRIWRGEFHRHTELSPDGGGDGALLDMWRYAIDAVGFDWIGDGDHDFGNGREYSWWTTQKAVTLFTIPGRFTPVFSYERSVQYPEGHRNVMFAHRGIRSLPRLPLSDENDPKPAPDTLLLYQYLHYFDGLCAEHTSATSMGTDWRNNDPAVEPFVEIYQGDRNNYERPDSPRSAVTQAKLKQSTPEDESIGGWRPKGFVNLALLKGYRLAFESSSDHISTHLSFCNVLVTDPSREGIIDAIKKRRVYGATENIIADVRVKAGGVDHLFGEEFATTEAPTLNIHLIGALPIAKLTIIKDDVVVYEGTPNAKDVKFDWTDPTPTVGKTSYYYVRGEQAPDVEGSTGELVWVSPLWIKYQGK